MRNRAPKRTLRETAIDEYENPNEGTADSGGGSV
jgi:hypothetical protein